MRYFLLLFIFISVGAFGQESAGIELTTSIDGVTIFQKGALLERSGKRTLSKGKTTLLIKGLSPYIDEKSVQVQAEGDFTIVAVQHKNNYLSRLNKGKRLDSLDKAIAVLFLKQATHLARLEVLAEKESVLDVNKKLGSQSVGVSLVQIKEAMQFYDTEWTTIKKEALQIEASIKVLSSEMVLLEAAKKMEQNQEDKPSGQIEVRVESESKTNANFKITYLTQHAGWFPKYDIRVQSVEEPILLKYKADVYQNTGVDWNAVKLKLSNGDPNTSGLLPKLDIWTLNFARNTTFIKPKGHYQYGPIDKVEGKVVDANGEGIPGANVVVQGTSVGTITDIEGNYSLTLPNGARYLNVSFVGYTSENIPIEKPYATTILTEDVSHLEEVVVTAYGLSGKAAGVNSSKNYGYSKPKTAKTIRTTTLENQTTVEFALDEPYSIQSNGEKLTVDLKAYAIETLYEYYAIPKLDKDAFLMARIFNWDQYHLLEGEANLYLEDKYVGRSILEARSMQDTLNISLGRDKSIVVGREKIDEFSKRRTLGKNKIERRGFTILARNKKQSAIHLTILDQLPKAAISDISITPIDLSNAVFNAITSGLKWELRLPPGAQKELILKYEVKSPKYEKIVLE